MILYQFKDNSYYEFILANNLEEAQNLQTTNKNKWAKSKIKPIAHIEDIAALKETLSTIDININKEIKFKPSYIGWYDYD